MRLILGLVLLGVFLVPLLRLVFRCCGAALFFITKPKHEKWPAFLRFIVSALSLFEYYFAPFRGVLASAFVVGALFWQIRGLWPFESPSSEGILNVAVLLFLAVLLAITRSARIKADVRAMEFLRNYPRLRPEAFFARLMRERAFGWGDLDSPPRNEEMVSTQSADFSEHKRARVRRMGVVLGFWDAMQLAKMALHALRNIGRKYFYENTDLIAVMIAKRLLQHCRANFHVSGLEKLAGLQGKFIFAFNHESSLDFMLAPFALSELEINGRYTRPRFFMAREHFRNFFVYHVLGIGKAAEALDMIFLNRKNARQSHASMKQAAQALVAKDIDLAIFPQGTRAHVGLDRAGKRRSAGYYTTVTRKSIHQSPDHLKKGVAHLVLDVLLEFESQGRDETLYLVFGGIDGAAKVLPRGRWSLETESEISFRFGDVLAFQRSMLADILPKGAEAGSDGVYRKAFVGKLIAHVDQKLVDVLDLPTKLTKRFFMDLKGQFRHYENDKLAQLETALRQAAQAGDPVYIVLDRLYALPVKDWNGYLSQFCQLLLTKPEPRRFDALLAEVTQKMIKA